ncbi:MAG: MotE family protein [Rhizobiaceae bacterium]
MVRPSFLTSSICIALAATLGASLWMTASAADKPRKQVRVVGNKSLVSAPAGNFCTNIKDDAQERRYALKLQELNKLKAAVEARIVALENKRAELEAWQRKRDQFAELADTSLVEIYSKMRPDAAAGRLEMLEPTLAAAIVLKMPRRKASVVMNEMSAKVAASITQVIASSTAAKEPS